MIVPVVGSAVDASAVDVAHGVVVGSKTTKNNNNNNNNDNNSESSIMPTTELQIAAFCIKFCSRDKYIEYKQE